MNTSSASEQPSIDFPSLLAEFDASGQSAAGFARSRGVAPWQIYHALNRRKGRTRRRPVATSASNRAFVPVHVVPDVASVRAASLLEIELAGGHRLRIGPDFDAALLRRVLGELARC